MFCNIVVKKYLLLFLLFRGRLVTFLHCVLPTGFTVFALIFVPQYWKVQFWLKLLECFCKPSISAFGLLLCNCAVT